MAVKMVKRKCLYFTIILILPVFCIFETIKNKKKPGILLVASISITLSFFTQPFQCYWHNPFFFSFFTQPSYWPSCFSPNSIQCTQLKPPHDLLFTRPFRPEITVIKCLNEWININSQWAQWKLKSGYWVLTSILA